MDKKYYQACQDFEKIVDLIILKYNPKKIYQWGSLLNREHFSEISDIDIALEGVTSAEQLFEIYGVIMNMSDFSIDLIQIEKIEPEFAELIIKNGRVVYERSE